jgi:excisionase family DNA binding protein
MANDHTAPARLYSILAASKALGVSRNTVFDLMAQGKLAFVRIGRRRLVPADAIERFIETNIVAKGGKGGRAA